jgi:protease-4
MTKKSGCLIALLIFVLVVSLGLNLGQFMGKLDLGLDGAALYSTAQPKKRFSEVTVESAKKPTSDKIVHLTLEGVISSMELGGLFGGAMPSVRASSTRWSRRWRTRT